jgi:hypothetical protein
VAKWDSDHSSAVRDLQRESVRPADDLLTLFRPVVVFTRLDRLIFLRELSRVVGLGGRDRRTGSASERARVSVTRAVRQALARIREHHAPLADHLERVVRTGTDCAYQPDPRAPIAWIFYDRKRVHPTRTDLVALGALRTLGKCTRKGDLLEVSRSRNYVELSAHPDTDPAL